METGCESKALRAEWPPLPCALCADGRVAGPGEYVFAPGCPPAFTHDACRAAQELRAAEQEVSTLSVGLRGLGFDPGEDQWALALRHNQELLQALRELHGAHAGAAQSLFAGCLNFYWSGPLPGAQWQRQPLVLVLPESQPVFLPSWLRVDALCTTLFSVQWPMAGDADEKELAAAVSAQLRLFWGQHRREQDVREAACLGAWAAVDQEKQELLVAVVMGASQRAAGTMTMPAEKRRVWDRFVNDELQGIAEPAHRSEQRRKLRALVEDVNRLLKQRELCSHEQPLAALARSSQGHFELHLGAPKIAAFHSPDNRAFNPVSNPHPQRLVSLQNVGSPVPVLVAFPPRRLQTSSSHAALLSLAGQTPGPRIDVAKQSTSVELAALRPFFKCWYE